ncbi:relaxase/mobilization nuclease RlxS [Novosphingobium sp. H3SJ31-1]|uniref:Relaxase/mobilization nuclease RlxS n=2 Tax=Novosphingobium album (ex Liu et al. 2023) TaxID=3031130 RepID=A0ABT5WQ64_9SPHN|nr:relaxase/mobilization nuclease RlxS [Novosphingobium album (ex Liu et al. 2023)]MDE8652174.1 relaxase/mobilization nuclease RlxS [Novosphingobium album (ex Liu et al. 2023)]
MPDDDFTPKLGRKRGKDGKRVTKYGGRILVAARLAGIKTGAKDGQRSRRFDGSRIGRGASMGRLLSSRDRLAGFRGRRAVAKVSLVRLGGKAGQVTRAHMHYVQRDGVTREGLPGDLYGPETDRADGDNFLKRTAHDRHQFRFIVSAEDGAEYPDLKPYVRRLMTQVEQDLGTKLDWVAVDHFNTERPHTHIILRGVDDQGDNLIIAREYISHGLRERASELVTLDLGPRTDQEIEARLRHDVDQERLTAIDRRLLRRMDGAREVSPADNDPYQQSIAAGRLRKLKAMDLAEDIGGGRYRLADGLEDTLRRMGERGDIIRLMQRELTARRLDRAGVEQVVSTELREPIVGRVIRRGFSDEHRDRHYVMIDGIDGRVHYIDIGRGNATPSVPESATVRLEPTRAEATQADRTVDAVARANDGRYSIDLHLRHDPNASEAFAASHVRRLEAMRRAGAGPERQADGSWSIPHDHLARAETFAQRQRRDRPVILAILSPTPIAELAAKEAPTWLDRELETGSSSAARDAGFGREVRTALASRRQWLIEQQLADGEGQDFRLRSGAMESLRQRELASVGDRLAEQLGKRFEPARNGERVEGVIARRVDLEGGPHALVERSRDFTLVPWRDVLERNIGKAASGIMRADGISWQFGRDRSGPAIG